MNAVTLAEPAAIMSAARIAAVSRVVDTNVVVRGKPFQFTTAPLTRPLPLTVSVNGAPPGAVVVGLKLVIAGTALVPTVVTAVALLLAPLESVEVVLTVAVLVTVDPTAFGCTTRLTLAWAPFTIVPRLHVTMLVPLQLP